MWASPQLYNAAHPLGPGPHLGSDNFVPACRANTSYGKTRQSGPPDRKRILRK